MKLTKAVRYRVEQFLRAMTAQHTISEQRIKKAAEILSPEAQALFAHQAPQDQRHALAVYETLLEEGHTNEDLLTAALLHDVGKVAAQIPAWQRGIFVLAKRFAPWALDRVLWNGNEGQGMPFIPAGPLVTYAEHAEIGARWAEKIGCSALTVELIRHHEHQPEIHQPADVAAFAETPVPCTFRACEAPCRPAAGAPSSRRQGTRPTWSEHDRLLAALQMADNMN